MLLGHPAAVSLAAADDPGYDLGYRIGQLLIPLSLLALSAWLLWSGIRLARRRGAAQRAQVQPTAEVPTAEEWQQPWVAPASYHPPTVSRKRGVLRIVLASVLLLFTATAVVGVVLDHGSHNVKRHTSVALPDSFRGLPRDDDLYSSYASGARKSLVGLGYDQVDVTAYGTRTDGYLVVVGRKADPEPQRTAARFVRDEMEEEHVERRVGSGSHQCVEIVRRPERRSVVCAIVTKGAFFELYDTHDRSGEAGLRTAEELQRLTVTKT